MDKQQASVTDGMMQILGERSFGLSLVPLSNLVTVPRVGETVNLEGESFKVQRVVYYFKSNGDESELASIGVNVTSVD